MTKVRNFRDMYWAIGWTLLAVFLSIVTIIVPTYPLWVWITSLTLSVACLIPARIYINRL